MMDPFSSGVELIDLRDHFAAGRWQEVVDYDTASLSPENKLPARVLALRARITLGDVQEVLTEAPADQEVPEVQAVLAAAEYATGNTSAALKRAEALVSSNGDNATVQVLAATILQNEGKTEEALALLSQHQGNCKSRIYIPIVCCVVQLLTMRQWRPSRSSFRFTYSKTGQTWR